MITHIDCVNFKCIDGKPFELKKLNIFSGYNGRGKSSVLQSILMLSQSSEDSTAKLSKLHLKGSMIDLGDFDEILTDDQNMSIGLNLLTDDTQFQDISLTYHLSDIDIKIGELTECKINGEDYFGSISKRPTDTGASTEVRTNELIRPVPDGLIKALRNVHYVSADRIGPVKYVDKKEIPDTHKIEPQCKNVINVINSYKEKIPACMSLNACESRNLVESVSEWLQFIMYGGSVKIPDKDSAKKNPVLTLRLGLDPTSRNRDFSTYNVGFGYSYILGIIVTALIAPENSIVIVENPEAHLHGQAQSRLTLLLSKLASRGVQVFIETHSEHIINGFRLEMLRNNCSLSHKDCAIYFFDHDFKVVPLEIKPNGKIPNWPDGFFDQETKDMAELLILGSRIRKD